MSARWLDALTGDGFVASLFGDEAALRAMLSFEQALAAAQAECGLLPAAAASAIAAACADFRPDWDALRAGMARDGVAAPALVAQLRAMLPAEARPFLHFQSTSQDAVDTGLVLRLRSLAVELDARLAAIVGLLDALHERDSAIALMGHTRMQAALPVTAGDTIVAWQRPLERHRARLAALCPRLLVVQCGGPVGRRDGQGDAVAAALAARLGLHDAPPWHNARDGIVEFGQFLALVAGSLGKIGQDVALLAQTEIGAVRVAGGGASSAMPHKSNPVAAEVLVALARHAAGLAGTLAQAMVHENERSGAAWTLEWLTLPPLAIATGAALRHAAALLRGLSFSAAGEIPP